MRLIDRLDNEEFLDLENARLIELNKKPLFAPFVLLDPPVAFGRLRLFKLDENGPPGFFSDDLPGYKFNRSETWPYNKEDFSPITNFGPLEINGKTYIFGKHTYTIKLSPDDYDGIFRKLFKAEAKILKKPDRFNWPDFIAYTALASGKSINSLDIHYFIKNNAIYLTAQDAFISALKDLAACTKALRADDLKENVFVYPLSDLLYRLKDDREPEAFLSYTGSSDQNNNTNIVFSIDSPQGKNIDDAVAKAFKNLETLDIKKRVKLQEAYLTLAAYRCAVTNNAYSADFEKNGVVNFEFGVKHLCTHQTNKKRNKGLNKALASAILALGAGLVVKFWPELSSLANSLCFF
jgi:hypothetical protein